MRELTSEEKLEYDRLQPRINERLMTEQEYANWLDNSYRNPRIQEIEDRLQEIKQEFIDSDWQAHKIALGEWSDTDQRTIDYKALRLALRTEQDTLIAELNGLNV